MTINVFDPVIAGAVNQVLGAAVALRTTRKYTKCTAYNSTASVVPIKIYLVPAASAASTANCYVDYDLQPRETYTCPEVVGGALKESGTMVINGPGVSFSAVSLDTTT